MNEATAAKVDSVIAYSRRRGIDALHVSVALDLVAAIPGRAWYPICCWCLDRIAHDTPDEYVKRLAMERWQNAGGCNLCPYSGVDTLVVSLHTPCSP